MGEAKRRRETNKAIEERASSIDYGRIAQAVNRLTRAASEHIGSDCLLQAALAQSILKRLGVPSELQLGFAAWRVGDGDGDVISHLPQEGVVQPSPKHIPFHGWLRVGERIFDVTTGQLRLKAARLDVQDGGHTQVDWAPDYLLARPTEASPYHEVRQGLAGLYFYHHDPALTERILRAMPIELDPQDEESAWFLYQNPDVLVLGPNDTPEA